MRHKKLSQKDISNIRERLLEPLTSKIEDIKKQIGERMVKIIDGETPKELLPFVKENSSFVKTTRYIYLWNLDYSDKVHLPVESRLQRQVHLPWRVRVRERHGDRQGVHAMRGHGEPNKERGTRHQTDDEQDKLHPEHDRNNKKTTTRMAGGLQLVP